MIISYVSRVVSEDPTKKLISRFPADNPLYNPIYDLINITFKLRM